ncbi:MAG: carboxymuconolactone decarboxylase family protein [Thermoleophilaceae bacterium]
MGLNAQTDQAGYPRHQRWVAAAPVSPSAEPARIDYCLDMHSKDARAFGESEQRLHLLATWGEEELEQTFSPDEIVALTFAIVAINGWNMLAISMRAPAGTYVTAPVRPTPNRNVTPA